MATSRPLHCFHRVYNGVGLNVRYPVGAGLLKNVRRGPTEIGTPHRVRRPLFSAVILGGEQLTALWGAAGAKYGRVSGRRFHLAGASEMAADAIVYDHVPVPASHPGLRYLLFARADARVSRGYSNGIRLARMVSSPGLCQWLFVRAHEFAAC